MDKSKYYLKVAVFVPVNLHKMNEDKEYREKVFQRDLKDLLFVYRLTNDFPIRYYCNKKLPHLEGIRYLSIIREEETILHVTRSYKAMYDRIHGVGKDLLASIHKKKFVLIVEHNGEEQIFKWNWIFK